MPQVTFQVSMSDEEGTVEEIEYEVDEVTPEVPATTESVMHDTLVDDSS